MSPSSNPSVSSLSKPEPIRTSPTKATQKWTHLHTLKTLDKVDYDNIYDFLVTSQDLIASLTPADLLAVKPKIETLLSTAIAPVARRLRENQAAELEVVAEIMEEGVVALVAAVVELPGDMGVEGLVEAVRGAYVTRDPSNDNERDGSDEDTAEIEQGQAVPDANGTVKKEGPKSSTKSKIHSKANSAPAENKTATSRIAPRPRPGQKGIATRITKSKKSSSPESKKGERVVGDFIVDDWASDTPDSGSEYSYRSETATRRHYAKPHLHDPMRRKCGRDDDENEDRPVRKKLIRGWEQYPTLPFLSAEASAAAGARQPTRRLQPNNTASPYASHGPTVVSGRRGPVYVKQEPHEAPMEMAAPTPVMEFAYGILNAQRAMDNVKRGLFEMSAAEIQGRFSRSDGIHMPTEREWEAVGELTKEAIAARLQLLVSNSSAARQRFEAAVAAFHLENETFSSIHAPNDLPGTRFLLIRHRSTSAAGNAIFGPQKAYQDAVLKLRLFVVDLLNLLPLHSVAKSKTTPLYNALMEEGLSGEERVRASFLKIGKNPFEFAGRERVLVGRFMDGVKERLEMLEKEEGKLVEWGRECVAAILSTDKG
ncbi:hypothetical protein K458DRAFT_406553 [Lentithecium fluviatile CBS 122367]|uniref:Uncharacterized protein n=1 Tax=Lentithecium fluviatile CBS 122367 TaxID=1168545 RepID=A0A6G1ISN7_9PLEO|nr:hypothetical protein K458DRAFT_406553 [Lentithecium fluviatile CBS 122367]